MGNYTHQTAPTQFVDAASGDGGNDVIVYTVNSFTLQQDLPTRSSFCAPTASWCAVPIPRAVRRIVTQFLKG